MHIKKVPTLKPETEYFVHYIKDYNDRTPMRVNFIKLLGTTFICNNCRNKNTNELLYRKATEVCISLDLIERIEPVNDIYIEDIEYI